MAKKRDPKTGRYVKAPAKRAAPNPARRVYILRRAGGRLIRQLRDA